MHSICNYNNKPEIIFENKNYAVVFKPRGIPTAPLKINEKKTLLSWFLELNPKAKNINGKKDIEAGLIHRLDTPTSGLVIIAKTQESYNTFKFLQDKNLITKTYTAFCNHITKNKNHDFLLPHTITSQFRPFGPKGKKVLPLFYDMRKFSEVGKMYSTTITNIEKYNDLFKITCTLTKGYRHQIRSHLCNIGFPIHGDALYNDIFTSKLNITNHNYPLQLFATKISFPSFKNSNEYISFSINPPMEIT